MPAHLPDDRGDHHDAPAAALEHVPQRGLGQVEGPGQVDVDHPAPVVVGHLEHGPVDGDAGVVDQDVQPAVLLDHLGDGAAAVVGGGDVAAVDGDVAVRVGAGEVLGEHSARSSVAAVPGCDVGALRRETRQIAEPIPRVPPVTKATLPTSFSPALAVLASVAVMASPPSGRRASRCCRRLSGRAGSSRSRGGAEDDVGVSGTCGVWSARPHWSTGAGKATGRRPYESPPHGQRSGDPNASWRASRRCCNRPRPPLGGPGVLVPGTAHRLQRPFEEGRVRRVDGQLLPVAQGRRGTGQARRPPRVVERGERPGQELEQGNGHVGVAQADRLRGDRARRLVAPPAPGRPGAGPRRC